MGILNGHTDIVNRIVFDENVLISISDDHSIITWVFFKLRISWVNFN